jgi:hypothetical protein
MRATGFAGQFAEKEKRAIAVPSPREGQDEGGLKPLFSLDFFPTNAKQAKKLYSNG